MRLINLKRLKIKINTHKKASNLNQKPEAVQSICHQTQGYYKPVPCGLHPRIGDLQCKTQQKPTHSPRILIIV